MRRNYVAIALLMMAIAVALGAFGAHGLEGKLNDHDMHTWEKATTYWVYVALSILGIVGFVQNKEDDKKNAQKILGVNGRIFSGSLIWLLMGAIIFSGTLWFVATSNLTWPNLRKLGMITPIGGVFMIVGYCCLGFRIWKMNR
ncbi:MAG: DUF423 domain-containing protein [Bacteroidia bacterium]|nr:DUF423 domain-containing protein [Bacteroidia bacterium]